MSASPQQRPCIACNLDSSAHVLMSVLSCFVNFDGLLSCTLFSQHCLQYLTLAGNSAHHDEYYGPLPVHMDMVSYLEQMPKHKWAGTP